MHALIQSVETLIVALATMAYAHFGVSFNHPPCPKAEQAVHRISYVRPVPANGAPKAVPCPLGKDVRRI
jgi:hypothetical protein